MKSGIAICTNHKHHVSLMSLHWHPQLCRALCLLISHPLSNFGSRYERRRVYRLQNCGLDLQCLAQCWLSWRAAYAISHDSGFNKKPELGHKSNLLRLLGSSLLGAGVAVDVSQVSSLLDATLDCVPTLSDSRGHVLAVGNGITTGGELVDSLLDECALVEASSEEDGVDDDEDPRTLLEEESGTEQTEPESDLKDGYEGHRRVVVILDEVANRVSKARSLGLLSSRSSRLRLDGGQEVGSGVGCNVENRVDGKGQNGQRNVTREEPDQGHGYSCQQ